MRCVDSEVIPGCVDEVERCEDGCRSYFLVDSGRYDMDSDMATCAGCGQWVCVECGRRPVSEYTMVCELCFTAGAQFLEELWDDRG